MLSTASLSHVGVSILGSTNTVSVIPLAQVRSGATEAQELLELERAKVLELAKENEVQRTSLTSQIETLREEVKQVKTRVRELWQTNCQQLLSHDNDTFEKKKEIELLSEKLQRAEMELARWKVEKLSGKLICC